MRIFLEKKPYKVVLLQPSADEKWLQNANLLRCSDEGHQEAFEHYQSQPNSFWDDMLKSPYRSEFLLFKDDEIIGMRTILLQNNRAYMTGLYVMQEHRGQRLSDLLYEAQLNFLITCTKLTTAEAHILPDNTPSIRAAKRHGFRLDIPADEDNPDSFFPYNIYSRSLDSLRPKQIIKPSPQFS